VKILLTLPRPLFPADTGGKIRSFNIFKRLASQAEIHAVSFADLWREGDAIAEMRDVFASYTAVPWQEVKRQSIGFYRDVIAKQISPLPYFLAKCNDPRFTAAVEARLAGEEFDLLFCDFLHTAMPCVSSSFQPKVMFEHNVEFMLRKRKWQVENRPIHRAILHAEWRKTKRLERTICQSFDHVLTVSDADKALLHQEFAIEHASVVPTGVDAELFHPSGQNQVPGRIVFVGSMDWDPNEDGVIWFLHAIYPKVVQALPNSSFVIAGRNPSRRLRAAASACKNVELTGWVSDVRPYLDQAEVVVVPLRSGGGTRIKIPEAMAMRRAVVSTRIGAEGLQLEDGRHICIADEPADFAASVIDLIRNPTRRSAIEVAARAEVVANYSWAAAVRTLITTLEQLVSGRLAFAA
jgi:glycosyltransferase involved in cell wall biosynthesis